MIDKSKATKLLVVLQNGHSAQNGNFLNPCIENIVAVSSTRTWQTVMRKMFLPNSKVEQAIAMTTNDVIDNVHIPINDVHGHFTVVWLPHMCHIQLESAKFNLVQL